MTQNNTGQLFEELIPAILEIDDGCADCIGGFIRDMNLIIRKYGYKYKFEAWFENNEGENKLKLKEIKQK